MINQVRRISFLKDSKIYKATKLTSLEIIVHNLDEEFLILNLNLKIVYRNDDFNSNLNKNFENVFLNYFEYNSAALILFKIKNSLREIQQSSYASKTAIIFYTNYEKAYKQILLIISVLIKDERILIKIKDITKKVCATKRKAKLLNNISHEFINIHELKYDLIIGERKIDSSNTSGIKIIGKSIINKITNFCFNEKIIDYNSGLRIFNKKKFIKHSHIMSNKFSLTTSMTIAFLNENYEMKFNKINYEKRLGQSKLGFTDFFRFIYTIFSLLFYYRPFKIILPIFIPLFLTFIFFLVKDVYSKDITDKTVLLFNFNFLTIILIFIIDRVNKFR